MSKTIKVGDRFFVGVGTNESGPWTSREKYFSRDQEGKERLDVPEGTVLHFPNGFMVRMYGDSGGAWGHPEEDCWTVTLTKKDGESGLQTPPHNGQFVNLKYLGHVAEVQVVSLPNVA